MKRIDIHTEDALSEYKNLKLIPQNYIYTLNQLIYSIYKSNSSITENLGMLYDFISDFNRDFVSNFTSCKKNCSACCKMDVQLTPIEAEFITYKTKIPFNINPKFTNNNVTPCPFLNSKSECSIYEYRPLLCRTYHSLSDPKLCYQPYSAVTQYGVPSADMSNVIYFNVFMWIQYTSKCIGKLDYKDIRDVFDKDSIIQYQIM